MFNSWKYEKSKNGFLTLVFTIFVWSLNSLFFPGIGLILIGKYSLGVLQMTAYFVGAVIVLSEGFGVTGSFATILGFVGVASMVSAWVWSSYSLVKSSQKFQIELIQNNKNNYLSISKLIFLNLFTFGLYYFYWVYKCYKTLNKLPEVKEHYYVPFVMTVFSFIPFIDVFVKYELSKRITEALEISKLKFLWSVKKLSLLFASPYILICLYFISMYLIDYFTWSSYSLRIFLIDNLNKIFGDVFIITLIFAQWSHLIIQDYFNKYWISKKFEYSEKYLGNKDFLWVAIFSIVWFILLVALVISIIYLVIGLLS